MPGVTITLTRFDLGTEPAPARKPHQSVIPLGQTRSDRHIGSRHAERDSGVRSRRNRLQAAASEYPAALAIRLESVP